MSGLLVGLGEPRWDPCWTQMVAELELLGGDGSAIWSDPVAGVTLSRAYRHEPATTHEPPIVEHESCVVAFDGRLASLEPAVDAVSDSRRVIESYLRWGVDCSAHLDGEFAFALWDARHARLLCACDVLGRRTLSFFSARLQFLACTRAVTLLRDPRVPRRLDGLYAAHVLCNLWPRPHGTTALASIRRLRPGHAISVQEGVLSERVADQLRLGPRDNEEDPAAAHERFWSLLDDSTRVRARGARHLALSLSGGLDSACVASSVTSVVGDVEAFSTLSDSAHLDERRAIEALLQRCRARWHVVPPPRARIFAAHDDGPVLDDPLPSAAALLPSRLHAWRAMAAAACDVVLDGEGGDEVFALPLTLGELAREGSWMAAARYIARHPSPRSQAVRWLVVPRLDRRLQELWLRRHGGGRSRVPAWLREGFRHGAEVREALRGEAARLRLTTWADLFPAVLEAGAAFRDAARLLACGVGLFPESPFFDRRIAELAGRAPARAMLSAAHAKIFLREACEARLPDEVRWRPKRERLYDALLRAALESPATRRLLEEVAPRGPLGAWVDPTEMRAVLRSSVAGRTLGANDGEKLHAIAAFAGWIARLEKEYGPLDTP